MLGQGIQPKAYHPMVDAAPARDISRYIEMNQTEVRAQLDGLMEHGAYIQRIAGKVGT